MIFSHGKIYLSYINTEGAVLYLIICNYLEMYQFIAISTFMEIIKFGKEI